jgi:homoserine dehydrogenase
VAAVSEPVRVGLLGCGIVGSALVRTLQRDGEHIAQRAGVALEITRVAVRTESKDRGLDLPPGVLTTDPAAVVTDPDVDVVVELIGGIEPARDLILDALKAGKPVVTANKELVANLGHELFEAADTAGVDLLFEAAVGGGIPLIRPLQQSLAGERIRRVVGIVNGTTNYVLDRMATEGLDLEQAVKEAQALGYAEADPTADVEGFDAAAKAAILASLAFHTRVSIDDVDREGITSVTADDVAWAERTGYVIKLLAIAERRDEGVQVRVHPALVPLAHPLAGVRGAFNAVFVEAEAAGELMFYGRGAGGAPTASAVLGDVVSAARHRVLGGKGPVESSYADLPVLPASAARTRYQIRLDVQDRPGVLAQVATVLATHEVSIEAVRQAPAPAGTLGGDGIARLIITTHEASEAALAATVAAIGDHEAVRRVISVLRVEGV